MKLSPAGDKWKEKFFGVTAFVWRTLFSLSQNIHFSTANTIKQFFSSRFSFFGCWEIYECEVLIVSSSVWSKKKTNLKFIHVFTLLFSCSWIFSAQHVLPLKENIKRDDKQQDKLSTWRWQIIIASMWRQIKVANNSVAQVFIRKVLQFRSSGESILGKTTSEGDSKEFHRETHKCSKLNNLSYCFP